MIRVEDVTKRFDDIVALDHVSAQINENCIFGLVGTNGAGKSTTIKIMSGILTPTSGECTIMDQTPWKERKKYVKTQKMSM